MSEIVGKAPGRGRFLVRLLALLLASLALGLVTDAWRSERVFFPKKNLPAFETVPKK
jgi:hypothetical protein